MPDIYFICEHDHHGMRVSVRLETPTEPLDGYPAPTCVFGTGTDGTPHRLTPVTRDVYDAWTDDEEDQG